MLTFLSPSPLGDFFELGFFAGHGGQAFEFGRLYVELLKQTLNSRQSFGVIVLGFAHRNSITTRAVRRCAIVDSYMPMCNCRG
jgi:hypothetical protein